MTPLTPFQAALIALIEGLTEFLPISSTAHMRFAHPLLGVQKSAFNDMFEVVIQLAAILAVLVLYRRKFFPLNRFAFYGKLLLALVPSIAAGVLLKQHIKAALDSLHFIAWVMVAGGVLLLFADGWFNKGNINNEQQVSNKTGFWIGCGQVLAVLFPGLSRSAATIISGMALGLTRQAAAEFSFFLAVPTMMAASAKSLWDTWQENPGVFDSSNLGVLAIGSVVSFAVALLAIKYFIHFLQKHGFRIWGIYRIVVGLAMLALLYTKTISA